LEEITILGEERDAAVTLHHDSLDQAAATNKNHDLQREVLQVRVSHETAYAIAVHRP
jgi:hypothetical protein